MRIRKYHTLLNLQVEPDMYTRLKMAASLKNVSMSSLVREGITLELKQIDKENNAMRED